MKAELQEAIFFFEKLYLQNKYILRGKEEELDK